MQYMKKFAIIVSRLFVTILYCVLSIIIYIRKGEKYAYTEGTER